MKIIDQQYTASTTAWLGYAQQLAMKEEATRRTKTHAPSQAYQYVARAGRVGPAPAHNKLACIMTFLLSNFRRKWRHSCGT